MEVAKDLSEFLKSVDESKDTPLKQINDRYLAKNNLRAQDAYDAVQISESQYRKLLTGKTGTKERPAEQLRQFLELPEDHWEYVFDSEAGRVRSHQDFNALRNRALGMVAEATPDLGASTSHDLRKLAILVLPIGVAGVLAISITGNSFTKSPLPASIPPDRPCIIDLRGEIPEKIACDEFGEFAVSGTSLKDWHTKASIARVPESWNAVSRHETWGEPNYSVLVEEESGFVHLATGDNYFGRQTFDVYDNEVLDGKPRTSVERELSDRLQYLIIYAVGDEPIVIWEHDHIEDPNRLTITHVK